MVKFSSRSKSECWSKCSYWWVLPNIWTRYFAERSVCRLDYDRWEAALGRALVIIKQVGLYSPLERSSWNTPHQALDNPDSQLYSASNDFIYAKNLIYDWYIYAHFLIICLCRSYEESPLKYKFSSFGNISLMRGYGRFLGLSRGKI